MTAQEKDHSNELRIEVAHPERYWFAVSSEMPWVVDPGIKARQDRHPDRSEIRWAIVGEVVQELGQILARENFPVATHESELNFELVTPDRFKLTNPERNIVESWFTNAEAPRADPWDDQLDNGRHRLSGVWQAKPDAELPVLSDLLLWDDSAESEPESFQQGLYLSAKVGSLSVPSKAPVRGRSKAYFDHLEHNASQLPINPETDADVGFQLMLSAHIGVAPGTGEITLPKKTLRGFLRRLFSNN